MRSEVVRRGSVIPGQLDIFVTLMAVYVPRYVAIVGNGAKRQSDACHTIHSIFA
jgi:hypothetical protein